MNSQITAPTGNKEGTLKRYNLRKSVYPPPETPGESFDTCNQSMCDQEEDHERDEIPEMNPDNLLQELVETIVNRPTSEIQPTKFSGNAEEDIHAWIRSFDRIATVNLWKADKKIQALPLYLTGQALVFFESLNDNLKQNYQQVSAELIKYFNSANVSWNRRTQLFSLTQTGSLEEYIKKLDKLAQQVGIEDEIKLSLFIKGTTPSLQKALKLKQPSDYQAAIAFARLQHATEPIGVTEKLENIEELLKRLMLAGFHTQESDDINRIKQQEGQIKKLEKEEVAAMEYENPAASAQELTRLKMEVRKLRQDQESFRQNEFRPNRRTLQPLAEREVDTSEFDKYSYLEQEIMQLRAELGDLRYVMHPRNIFTPEGEPICNYCHRVGHM